MSLFSFFKKEKTPLQQLIDFLNLRLKEAAFNNDWEKRQEIALNLLWLDCIKNEEAILKEIFGQFYLKGLANNISNLNVEDFTFPEELDPNNLIHLKFSEKVIQNFGAVLENAGKWKNCLYKPDSILPYPKYYIIFNIEFILSEGKISEKMKQHLKASLTFLDSYFIEINPRELPTNQTDNIKVGTSYKF